MLARNFGNTPGHRRVLRYFFRASSPHYAIVAVVRTIRKLNGTLLVRGPRFLPMFGGVGTTTQVPTLNPATAQTRAVDTLNPIVHYGSVERPQPFASTRRTQSRRLEFSVGRLSRKQRDRVHVSTVPETMADQNYTTRGVCESVTNFVETPATNANSVPKSDRHKRIARFRELYE